jgi:glycerate kinase
VKNPVYGEKGAAYVYAPQKGASAADVVTLDNGLRHVCEMVKKYLNKDVSSLVGGGAAGAMAGGMYAFTDVLMKMGIEVVLDTVGFERHLKDADLVLTGEGKLDGQSLEGKVVVGVAQRAKKYGVPTIAIVGGVEENLVDVYEKGITAVFTINRRPEPLEISRDKSAQNLQECIDDILRLTKIFNGKKKKGKKWQN